MQNLLVSTGNFSKSLLCYSIEDLNASTMQLVTCYSKLGAIKRINTCNHTKVRHHQFLYSNISVDQQRFLYEERHEDPQTNRICHRKTYFCGEKQTREVWDQLVSLLTDSNSNLAIHTSYEEKVTFIVGVCLQAKRCWHSKQS